MVDNNCRIIKSDPGHEELHWYKGGGIIRFPVIGWRVFNDKVVGIIPHELESLPDEIAYRFPDGRVVEDDDTWDNEAEWVADIEKRSRKAA